MLAQADFFDADVENAVGAHVLMLEDAAVQVGEGVVDLQLAAAAAVPDVLLETLFVGEFGDAGKMLSGVLLVGGKHVDAQLAVAGEDRADAGVEIDAQHHGGRGVGNRRDRGHGDAVAAVFAVGGNQIDAGGAGGHGVAEILLDAVHGGLPVDFLRAFDGADDFVGNGAGGGGHFVDGNAVAEQFDAVAAAAAFAQINGEHVHRDAADDAAGAA